VTAPATPGATPADGRTTGHIRRERTRAVILTGLAIWAVLPLALLLLVSLSGGWRFPTLLGVDPGLGSWPDLAGGSLVRATLTSLGLGVATGVSAAVMGLVIGRGLARTAGWRRVAGAMLSFLPVAVPPIVLGVGLQFSFLSLGLGGTFVGVWLAHLVPATGYATLYFMGVFTAWNFGIEEAARRLGATRVQTIRRVVVPLLRRPLAEAALLGFLVSWAQVPLTLVLGQGRIRSLTVEVLTLVEAGQDGLAAAGSILLVVPPILLMGVAVWGVREAEVVVA